MLIKNATTTSYILIILLYLFTIPRINSATIITNSIIITSTNSNLVTYQHSNLTILNLSRINMTDPTVLYKQINEGSTTFLIFTGILVMLMTPALGLFYSGFASNKRIVMIVGQCFGIYSIISII